MVWRRRLSARRKSLSFRSTGKQAQYLTVIEPFEKKSVVESVTASSANELTVKLKDGRTHVLKLSGLKAGKELSVEIQEFKDNRLIHEVLHKQESSDTFALLFISPLV